MNPNSQSESPPMSRKVTAIRRKATAEAGGKARSGAERAGRSATLREDFRSFARMAILSAAEEVLADEGLHAARIEEIANRARVAVGTIYNLVGDREALVREILHARHAEVVTLLATTLNRVEPQPFREQVHGLVVAIFEYFGEHRRFFRLVLEAERAADGGKLGPSARKQKTVLEIRKRYAELVERGVKAGALRAEGSALYPAMLSGMLREVMLQDLELQERASPEARADLLTRMFLEGAGT